MEVPLNAQYVRNIILCAHGMHDHIVHFYHLSALNWVDIISALKANPKKTAELAQTLSDWKGNSVTYFKAVQEKLKALVESGQLGPFTNGYWGHPQMKLSPEVNLLGIRHYLTALEYQFIPNKVVAILGGKILIFKLLLVGVIGLAIDPDSDSALNRET